MSLSNTYIKRVKKNQQSGFSNYGIYKILLSHNCEVSSLKPNPCIRTTPRQCSFIRCQQRFEPNKYNRLQKPQVEKMMYIDNMHF